MRTPNLHVRGRRKRDYGFFAFFVVVVIIIIVQIVTGGALTGDGLIECKGTTGIYREYDSWADEYQRYTVPDDPACMDSDR